MFGIGGTELIVLVIVVAILIGPDQIPGVLKGIQKFVREVTKARDDFKTSIDSDETLSSIKKSVDDVKRDVQGQLDDVTKGVREDLEKIKRKVNDQEDDGTNKS